jgi:hypothetical protein
LHHESNSRNYLLQPGWVVATVAARHPAGLFFAARQLSALAGIPFDTSGFPFLKSGFLSIEAGLPIIAAGPPFASVRVSGPILDRHASLRPESGIHHCFRNPEVRAVR